MSKVRVRFAPSPTGFLHIGSLRTVLFNYLIAKKESGPSAGFPQRSSGQAGRGQLILRIEDTDQKREVAGAIKSLIEILDWLGFQFDEGPQAGGKFGPYIQSERLEIYKKYAAELLKKRRGLLLFLLSGKIRKNAGSPAGKKRAPAL